MHSFHSCTFAERPARRDTLQIGWLWAAFESTYVCGWAIELLLSELSPITVHREEFDGFTWLQQTLHHGVDQIAIKRIRTLFCTISPNCLGPPSPPIARAKWNTNCCTLFFAVIKSSFYRSRGGRWKRKLFAIINTGIVKLSLHSDVFDDESQITRPSMEMKILKHHEVKWNLHPLSLESYAWLMLFHILSLHLDDETDSWDVSSLKQILVELQVALGMSKHLIKILVVS